MPTPPRRPRTRVFPAMLVFFRKRRGFSQLRLAVEAGVSPRHVSFLESGRATASEAMALRLMSTLRVPLREQNDALRALGVPPRFDDASLEELPREIGEAIDAMLAQHEPYPMTVVTPDGSVIASNRAATRIFAAFVADPRALPTPIDMVSLLFDPMLMRPFVIDWESVARSVLCRLSRERLDHPRPELVDRLLERALSFPDVPASWRFPDFSRPISPAFVTRLERDGLRVAFLVTITTLSSPSHVTLEELRFEAAHPLDDETREVCRGLVEERRPLRPRARRRPARGSGPRR